jgi:hypothetical protein
VSSKPGDRHQRRHEIEPSCVCECVLSGQPQAVKCPRWQPAQYIDHSATGGAIAKGPREDVNDEGEGKTLPEPWCKTVNGVRIPDDPGGQAMRIRSRVRRRQG